MQRAETAVLEKPQEKLELTKLADVSIDKDNKIYVNWAIDKKELVVMGLAEAIKLVETYKPSDKLPEIIKPKPNFMDFVKGIKR